MSEFLSQNIAKDFYHLCVTANRNLSVRIETADESLDLKIEKGKDILLTVRKAVFSSVKIYTKGYFLLSKLLMEINGEIFGEHKVDGSGTIIKFQRVNSNESGSLVCQYGELLNDYDILTEDRLFSLFFGTNRFGMLKRYLSLANMSGFASISTSVWLDGKIVEEILPFKGKLFLRLPFNTSNPVSRKILSLGTKFAGTYMNHPRSKKHIASFIKAYEIDTSEFLKDISEFKNFNEFFSREIKMCKRPIKDPEALVSPADNRMLFFTTENDAKNVWIKGKRFSLKNLLQKNIDYKGIFIHRLAPQDYHRFHSPTNATVKNITNISGAYLSVHPHFIKTTDVFTENSRIVIELHSKKYGLIHMVVIGAALVGSIVLKIKIGQELKIGETMGYFQYGGSSIIMILNRKIKTNETVRINSMNRIETFVRVNESIADKL